MATQVNRLKQALASWQRKRRDAVSSIRAALDPAQPEAGLALNTAADKDAPAFRPALVAALVGALGLAVLGQYLLTRSGAIAGPGLVILTAGLAFMVLAHWLYRRRALPWWLVKVSARLRLTVDQPLLLVTAIACAYAAKVIATDSPLLADALLPYLLWGLAIGLSLLGSYRRGLPADGAAKAEAGFSQPWGRRERLAVALLFVGAFCIRVAGNDAVPAALSGDEGSAGLMALDWIEGRFNNPFVSGWFSFPSLFFTLPAGAIAFLGRNYAALRLPSALAGSLTVIGLYWMARPMFGRVTATISAVVLAGLTLHVHFSRIGLNNIWDGLFIVLAVGCFWRGWQSGRRGYFVATGLIIGFSQYFYTSALLLPLLLAAWIGLQLMAQPARLRDSWPDLLLLVVVALVVYLPLSLFYFAHPDEFFAPINRVSLLHNGWFEATQRATGQSIVQLLLMNFRDAFLAFTSVPLRAWFGSGQPLLQPLAAGLFALGLALLVMEWRAPRSWLALLWIAGVVGIGALTESTPAGQRYVIATPVAALLVGLALATTSAWLRESWPGGRRVINLLALALVVFSLAQDLRFYFGRYAPTIGQGDPNTQVASTLGRHLQGYPAGTTAYFFGPPRMSYRGFSTLRFLAPNVEAIDVAEAITAPPDWPMAAGRSVFVFLPERQGESAFVLERYPGGEGQWHYNHKGEALFWLYEPPPGTATAGASNSH